MSEVAGYAINDDDELWAWGRGVYGSLGQNSTADSTTPVQITGEWLAVAGMSTGAHAVKKDGTLWHMGDGYPGAGGLGRIGAPRSSSPTQVGSLTTWLNVFGRGHPGMMAIRS